MKQSGKTRRLPVALERAVSVSSLYLFEIMHKSSFAEKVLSTTANFVLSCAENFLVKKQKFGLCWELLWPKSSFANKSSQQDLLCAENFLVIYQPCLFVDKHIHMMLFFD